VYPSFSDVTRVSPHLSTHPLLYGQRLNRPISVYRFPRRALTLCPQLCMGMQPGARCPARSADALPATLYGYCTQAIYRNRPIRNQDSKAVHRILVSSAETGAFNTTRVSTCTAPLCAWRLAASAAPSRRARGPGRKCSNLRGWRQLNQETMVGK
jgi:hypothetical protein